MIAIRNAVRISGAPCMRSLAPQPSSPYKSKKSSYPLDPIAMPGDLETDETIATDWVETPPRAQHVALWRYLQGRCSEPVSSTRGALPGSHWNLRVMVGHGESEGLEAAFQMAAAAAHGDETAAELLVNAATRSEDEAIRRVASYALTAAGTSDSTGQHAVKRLIGILERGAEALEVPACEHSDLIDRRMNVLVMVVHAIGQLAGCMAPATAGQAARAVAGAMEHATAEIALRERSLPEETRQMCVPVFLRCCKQRGETRGRETFCQTTLWIDRTPLSSESFLAACRCKQRTQ